jgi:CheY-like chemotaxis protein
MEYVIDNAEQKACKYLSAYRGRQLYANAAFFKMSMTSFYDRDQRVRVERFFQTELSDPKAVIFQFGNGDIFALSEHLTPDFIVKAARYLGLGNNNMLHSLPGDYDEVAAILSRYLETYKEKKQAQCMYDATASLRERFLDIEVAQNLYMVLDQMRSERRDIKVLVIDDDEFALRFVRKALGNEYAVDVAHSALEGFRKYACLAPDIIFLDINMPAVSGHDFLSKIFEMDPKAFVVVISGHDDQYNISKAGYLGARGFMSKPFAFDEMDSYIQQCAAQPEMVV